VATAIAILFHMVGLVGMLFFKSDLIIASTPIHLLLMAALIFYTHPTPNGNILFFFLVCITGGYLVEYIGIHTSILFGNYKYGDVLGPKLAEVPLIIGINWFIIMYMCGICMSMMLQSLRKKAGEQVANPSRFLKLISLVVDGATLAVFMDWLIEPAAIKLGYWYWLGNGDIPVLNYISWFVVSLLFLLVFHLLPFKKHNKFAVNLLLIQAMFFLLLRTFL
jgi:putative membrane protein